ncbi:uncharacterized protein KY384_008584 [Bacidia gigantensis]|uniref:uncharacterized protein n=1 Tax=Bacidia gigantensis TaxID=2732470 RepID=UPI001D04EAB3|nr:uncharacterized protein KY384_008584 [Bacidia gigantensis]KAG8527154.1 hypothetical protein KY384_008584 [Bacidia gigantensis]
MTFDGKLPWSKDQNFVTKIKSVNPVESLLDPGREAYNSAISSSQSEHESFTAVVTQDFVDGAPTRPTLFGESSADEELNWIRALQKDVKTFERSGNLDCIKANYKSMYNGQSETQGPIFIVIAPLQNGTNVLFWDGHGNSFNSGAKENDWGDTYNELLAHPDSWVPLKDGTATQYCLIQQVPEKCTLDCSLGLLILITIMNAIKCFCMLLLFIHQKAPPLITVGDAISSFLDEPDMTTQAYCYLDYNAIQWSYDEHATQLGMDQVRPQSQDPPRYGSIRRSAFNLLVTTALQIRHPLLISSILLHWLVSQAIYYTRLTTYDPVGNVDEVYSVSATAFSPIAIIFCIIVGGIMLITLVANGFRKYNTEIPLAGSCSAAISAFCHRPGDDADAAVLPVKWGMIEGAQNQRVGHCSFTSHNVSDPVPGHLYAGL